MDPWDSCTCYCDSCPITKGTRHFAIVSNDAQTDKQQHATERFNFSARISRHHVLNQAKARTGCVHNVGLLRTCRQVYYEARSVLYQHTTFVFSCLATYAAYFGLSAPSGVFLSRSTEPHRLRAIQAMTKVELRGIVGQNPYLDFLSTTRLIRASLGCLTNLASFALGLQLQDATGERRKWMIDDSMFSKSASLRELVLGVWSRQFAIDALLTEEDELEIAKELLHRILKRDDFSDTIECFRRDKDTAASTESL